MQVLVKTPKAKIQMEGEIPSEIINVINNVYKSSVKILDDSGEELILANESKAFNSIKDNTTPGDIISIYRENLGLTQADLGMQINKTAQFISDLENDRRNISINVAKALSKIFDISIARLIK